MIIAIDFDGTIHDWAHLAPGYRLGPPFEGCKEALNKFKEAGHKIIIHSCNRPKIIRDWMEYFQIPFDWIWGESPTDGPKPIADFYIDDRALEFKGDWNEMVKRIDESPNNI